jgi:hypothetical protein
MLSIEEAQKREAAEKAAKQARKQAKAEKLAKKLAKAGTGGDDAAAKSEYKKRKAAEDSNSTAAAVEAYLDRWLVCGECGGDFCFSSAEQRFFAEKGYAAKSRCAECTKAKKARFNETSGKGTAAEERAAKTTCYTCGELGHASKDCTQAACYNCGMKGHKSKDCKSPRNNQAGGGVCFKFQSGTCTRGDTCRFAHIKE